ncbi:hypothetical protein [Pseudactinotalea sp.]|uniref:hypothetical protein n=1 Tax=Pseudactinotalea sp. TaxID=1926260 RepID=UPI003B3A2B31
MRLPWVPQPPARTSQDDPAEPPDDHTVPVEQPDGSVVWCAPEAAQQWDPAAWRAHP